MLLVTTLAITKTKRSVSANEREAVSENMNLRVIRYGERFLRYARS